MTMSEAGAAFHSDHYLWLVTANSSLCKIRNLIRIKGLKDLSQIQVAKFETFLKNDSCFETSGFRNKLRECRVFKIAGLQMSCKFFSTRCSAKKRWFS